MTQIEILKSMCNGEEEKDFEDWVLILLGRIAQSTAIIADKLTEKTDE